MDQTRTIDVTGLPEPVVAGLQQVVSAARASLSAQVSGTPPTNPSQLPYDEWKKRFEEWANRPHAPGPGFVDDSRESIYEGR